ncbi:ribonuclease H [Leptolyngbya phage Lbo240-yong1]|uniref:Ribonuclease H n=1 Tax=Leptolyngbya phage Lbo240-yong1 TaxID=2928836 RepID=A0A9X9E588_9CAUD|nr:ribonuclease H [Leptolyngbya phage Lbo240-yong1]
MIKSLKPSRPRIGAKWSIHCDGATFETNPSSMGGWGFAVFCDDQLWAASHGQLVGDITNQVAELQAISKALLWCVTKGLRSPVIISDSKVAIDVQTGESELRKHKLLCIQASIRHSLNFIEPTFEHVPRTNPYQRFADYLANLGNHGSGVYQTLEQHKALISSYELW